MGSGGCSTSPAHGQGASSPTNEERRCPTRTLSPTLRVRPRLLPFADLSCTLRQLRASRW